MMTTVAWCSRVDRALVGSVGVAADVGAGGHVSAGGACAASAFDSAGVARPRVNRRYGATGPLISTARLMMRGAGPGWLGCRPDPG